MTDDKETECAEAQESARRERLSRIKKTVMVLSGKGGVGKSTVAVNLAVALSQKGYRTGILDADIHGPNVPKMLGLEREKPMSADGRIIPIEKYINGSMLKVMSLAFFIEKDSPVIWRGPMKMGLIQQFTGDVEWGDLDYLVVDLPPGTGDEALSIAQTIPDVTGSVIVSTPQDVALMDSRRAVEFSRKLSIPVLGIVENMAGLKCPHCGKDIDLFKTGGAEHTASEMGAPFLGRIPIDADIVRAGDDGTPFLLSGAGSEAAREFDEIVGKLTAKEKGANNKTHAPSCEGVFLKVLVEDVSRHGHYKAEHGLSIYLETGGRKALFDTGQSGLFLENAKNAGLSLDDLDYVVISHGHHDHTGGLPHVPAGKKTVLVAHPGYTRKRFLGDRYIGAPEFDDGFIKDLSATPVRITENMYFLGEIPGARKHPLGEYVKDGAREVDYVPDDSALAINGTGGLTVVCGCAHAGIVNTVSYAKSLWESILQKEISEITLVGGFHMEGYDAPELEETIGSLKALGVKTVYPGHCTGEDATARLLKEFSGTRLYAGIEMCF